MAKKSRPNRAKSIVAQPLFRCRQEKPKKGKGSYRREASQSYDSEASVFLGVKELLSAMLPCRC
ncbi:alternative ribosome rescue factor ArfA [Pseudomonas sp. Marseille-QA0892]